jgi:hypothetical protein
MIDLELIVDFFSDCWWLLLIVIGIASFVYNFDNFCIIIHNFFNPEKEDLDCFDDEECPDCTAPIPIVVADGQSCEYCGHVFNYCRTI